MRVRTVLAAIALAGSAALAGAGNAAADAEGKGYAVGSPGVLSGNVVLVPAHVPVNVCGNTVNVIAAANPALGNLCINR
ncbi:chaplin [Streptomyces sp. NPDC002851]